MPKCRIGCSGFLYDSWRGNFYPEGLPHKKWLPFYVEKFNSVELNVTFYRLLKKETFARWYKETPDDFTFILKGSRFISHIKKLKDVELPLSSFFNVTTPLKEKFGIVLWKLPPNLKMNTKSLVDFIEVLKQYPVHHVFEFRHRSWLNKKVYNILSAANVAVCMSDWPEYIDDLPVTADFVYLRRQGEGGSYATNYTTEQLKKDAGRIRDYLQRGKDVYIFFNNDAFGYAPKNALALKAILEKTLPKSLREAGAKKAVASGKAAAKKAVKKKAAKKAVKKKAVKKAVKKKAVKKAVKKKAVKKAVKKKAVKKAVKKKAVKKAVKKKAVKKVVKKKAVKKAKKKPSRKPTVSKKKRR